MAGSVDGMASKPRTHAILVDEVDSARDVGPEARHLPHVHPGVRGATREAQAIERGEGVAVRDGDAQGRAHAVVAERDGAPRQGLRLEHPLLAHPLGPRELAGQRGGAGEDPRGVAPVDAALEAVARLGVQAVAPRGAPHAARVEVRALEQDARGGLGDLAVAAAHDPRERDGAGAVADDQVVGGQGAGDAVEGDELLALGGAAHDDSAAADAVEVERVHGVAALEHHEVGHVDEVRDGPHAEGGKAPARLERRGRHMRVEEHGRAVVGAAVAVLDGDGHVPAEVLVPHAGHGLGHGRNEGHLEDGRGLAREADVPQPVGPVGREVDSRGWCRARRAAPSRAARRAPRCRGAAPGCRSRRRPGRARPRCRACPRWGRRRWCGVRWSCPSRAGGCRAGRGRRGHRARGRWARRTRPPAGRRRGRP